MYHGNAISNKYVLSFINESFRGFNCNREFILVCRHSYRERMQILSICLGTKSYLESVLGISEKCSRLAKYDVDC